MLRNLMCALVLLATSAVLGAGEPPVESRLKTPDEQYLAAGDRKAYPDKVILPFWEIGLCEFDADTPRPIAIPRKTGEPDTYWYWPFRFRSVTSLAYVKAALEEVINKDETREADRDYYRQHLARVEKTLAMPKRARLFIVIHTDTGEIIPDESNPAVRNMVERKLRRRLHTTADIAAKPLQRGQMVEGVAIFPRMDPKARSMEIRVYGLGKRFLPTYEPSDLLFLENNGVFRKTLRRALRFTYRRVGNADERLAPIQLEQKKSDWIWIWTSQIYAGRWRKIEIERSTDLKDKAGNEIKLKREYRYVPYKIWNDTHLPQSLDVMRAGLRFPIVWKGQRIMINMPDIGEPDDFWKTQVDRTWKARISEGWEKQFVEQYEKPGAGATGEMVEQDIAAKADILPASGIRHPRGIIEPLERVKGMIVVRWGVYDVDGIVDTLVRDIRIAAVAYDVACEAARQKGQAEPEPEGALLKAYLALRPPAKKGQPYWMRPADPVKGKVVEMLLKQAAADLQERGSQPGEDEKRRYGRLAPIGHLLNLISAEYVQKRADGGVVPWKKYPEARGDAGETGGVVDVFFEVKWDGVIDRSSFPSNFKRRLPSGLDKYKRPEVEVDLRRPVRSPTGGGEEEEGKKEEKKEEKKDEKKEEKKDEEALPWD